MISWASSPRVLSSIVKFFPLYPALRCRAYSSLCLATTNNTARVCYSRKIQLSAMSGMVGFPIRSSCRGFSKAVVTARTESNESLDPGKKQGVSKAVVAARTKSNESLDPGKKQVLKGKKAGKKSGVMKSNEVLQKGSFVGNDSHEGSSVPKCSRKVVTKELQPKKESNQISMVVQSLQQAKGQLEKELEEVTLQLKLKRIQLVEFEEAKEQSISELQTGLMEMEAAMKSALRQIQRAKTIMETLKLSIAVDTGDSMKIQREKISEVIYELKFDGACKGNPGKAGAAAVLRQGDSVICRISEGLGITTNNVAEYRALIRGLKAALQKGVASIDVKGDSLLVVKQVSGEWKVHTKHISELFEEVKNLQSQFKHFRINHVLREFNSEADKLAKTAAKLSDGEIISYGDAEALPQ